jgi:hypothetical protein
MVLNYCELFSCFGLCSCRIFVIRPCDMWWVGWQKVWDFFSFLLTSVVELLIIGICAKNGRKSSLRY